MPYLLKLEMERTRQRIRKYLCNVFSGYEFRDASSDGRSSKLGPNHLTATEWIEGCYRTSWHFKGDPSTFKIADYNSKTKNGDVVKHRQRVWFFDHKGRTCTGTAYYNINNMWWVMTGKYDVRNLASFDLLTTPPQDIRRKRNEKLRERRLTELMDEAAKARAFEKAALYRDLLNLNKDMEKSA